MKKKIRRQKVKVTTRRARLAVNVARMMEKRMHRGFLWRNLKEINHMEPLGVDEEVVFKTGLNVQYVGRYCSRSFCS